MSKNEIREIMQDEVRCLINMAHHAEPANRQLFMHQGFGMIQLYLNLFPEDTEEFVEWWDDCRAKFFQ